MTIPSKTKIEELKYRIRCILWEKNFIKDLNRDITENLVSPPYRDEYLGRDGKPLDPLYLRTITKMFSSMLLNFVMDKVIDAVIDAQEELKLRNPHQER